MEIQRHDWSSIECGCGQSAQHLLPILDAAIDGQSRSAVRALDNHVFIQSNLMPSAPAVCAVAMAVLADAEKEMLNKREILWLLCGFVGCEEYGDSVESSLYWRCVGLIRDGIWVIYRELLSGGDVECASYASDILEVVERDPERYRYYAGLLDRNSN
ncbi:hypothetical protein ACFXCZ_07475 [Streptomyces sp. NPDC059396]|uniref:hypothetical protein n=1 Tax=Streptomyces sp. NPDC059396 TaxID=3346819 RepID=UPI00367FD2D1